MTTGSSPTRGGRVQWVWAALLTLGGIAVAWAARAPDAQYTVLAANDLGMHCMQNDFSQMMILPPFNTVRVQVIRRGSSPDLMTSDVAVSYAIPENTHSSDKTNFWRYAQELLGVGLAPDVGVAGYGLAGAMTRDSSHRGFIAEGVPLTPIDDDGKENPYPLALINVKFNNVVVGRTQAVVPVSWEMSCNLCHTTPGESTATNILKAHDRLHGTDLINHQPVMCAQCHSDNALGAPGTPGVSSLSHAMHGAHASRMDMVDLANDCYACHPGVRTTCQRDVHAAKGMSCIDCHGTMATVANPTRNPWLQEPRCADCHTRAGYEFEQPGTLFRNSVGHGGVQCISCHGSPHAQGPAITETDNVQAIRMQGHPGVIGDCTVCHITTPSEPFPHRRDD